MTLNSAIGELIFLVVVLASGATAVWMLTFLVDTLMWLIQNFFGLCVWLYVKVRYVWFKR